MIQLICLANSWKHGERCIAGIDQRTGQWIRPVTNLDDGRVPRDTRMIGGAEPALLDILSIPLAETGPHDDFERENRSILPGRWRRLGRARPAGVRRYCDDGAQILHNPALCVSATYLRALPPEERQTLQLVETVAFSARPKGRRHWGGNSWEGTLVTRAGQRLTASITDPVFVERLDIGHRPANGCLVTVSLGLPFPPGADSCWKLIAAVIELDGRPDISAPLTAEELADVPF